MLRQAERLADEKKWSEAKPMLQKLIQLYPDFTGADSPYRTLASTHRELGETNAERQVLTQLAQKDDRAPDVYLRLMELATQDQDWPAVITNAQRYLGVNPLVPAPYRYLARASEATAELPMATEACRALLLLDPPNPAEVHFQLASLLQKQGSPEARRHVLQALEEAPRYREALRLLRRMSSPAVSTGNRGRTADAAVN
jgi:tetratricopeptide (TPR) repeat protein